MTPQNRQNSSSGNRTNPLITDGGCGAEGRQTERPHPKDTRRAQRFATTAEAPGAVTAVRAVAETVPPPKRPSVLELH